MQHEKSLQNHLEIYHLGCCPYCGKTGLWRHGFRYRKSDRENYKKSTLNPIPILRLYCRQCKRTCSVLPECIPPLRWYLWVIQEVIIKLRFSGISYNKISQHVIPSRWTISRWINRLIEKFKTHAFHLKSKWSWLGYKTKVDEFWLALLDKSSLSQAMFFLNSQTIFVP
jgi:hypothetical protein